MSVGRRSTNSSRLANCTRSPLAALDALSSPRWWHSSVAVKGWSRPMTRTATTGSRMSQTGGDLGRRSLTRSPVTGATKGKRRSESPTSSKRRYPRNPTSDGPGAEATNLPWDRPWTIEELATFLQVSTATIYNWRYLGRGPRDCGADGLVRYWPKDVVAWLNEQADGGGGD